MPFPKTIQAFKWSNIIFLVSAVLMLTLSIVAFYLLQKQKKSSDLVNRTYRMTSKMHQAYSSLMNAEAGQRGYLLTGDSNFLYQYTNSISDIPPLLSELDSLMVDEEQKKKLQTFSLLLQHRIQWMETIIDSALNPEFRNLDQLLKESRRISDQTRNQIALMEEKENEALKYRLTLKKSNERIATVFVLIFSVVSLVLLIISFSWLRQESLLRIESESQSAVLERKIAERTGEIREMNRRLNLQNEILEKRNEELHSFTYIASHDLKEPLRKIATFSGQILARERERLSESGQKSFERIIAAVRQMQSLIESVLMYAQAENTEGFETLPLNRVAAEAIEILQETIEETGAVVSYSDLPAIIAIPDQMKQLFVHLLSNALKYTDRSRKPEVVITARRTEGSKNRSKTDDGWLLSFTDNGIGFNEKYKHKIFQIFQRLHGKTDYSGTGIGLAICKKIVDNHRGYITVHSEEGKGSEFVVFLPAQEQL